MLTAEITNEQEYYAVQDEIQSLEQTLEHQRESDTDLPLPLQKARESATAGRIAELNARLESFENSL